MLVHKRGDRSLHIYFVLLYKTLMITNLADSDASNLDKLGLQNVPFRTQCLNGKFFEDF